MRQLSFSPFFRRALLCLVLLGFSAVVQAAEPAAQCQGSSTKMCKASHTLKTLPCAFDFMCNPYCWNEYQIPDPDCSFNPCSLNNSCDPYCPYFYGVTDPDCPEGACGPNGVCNPYCLQEGGVKDPDCVILPPACVGGNECNPYCPYFYGVTDPDC